MYLRQSCRPNGRDEKEPRSCSPKLAARTTRQSLTLATALSVAAVVASVAHAQDLFLTSGSYTANDAQYRLNTIYVGEYSGGNLSSGGTPYFATLNVVTGGNVGSFFGYNACVMNMSGGIVNGAVSDGTSTLNISGGSVNNVAVRENSTANFSGGVVNLVYCEQSSTTNISSGTFMSGFGLNSSTASVNFVGTGLSFAYQSSGSSMYSGYADFFKVSGTVGGATNTYDLYIRNTNGVPNSTPRQFRFNGAAVAVPEAGSLALLLPAMGILGAVVARSYTGAVRRK